MPKYEVCVREISYYWYLVDAQDEEDARNNWHEGTFVSTDWDASEFDVITMKKEKEDA